MRAVIQRVTSASVAVDGEVVGQIERGLCVLVGVTHDDTEAEATWLAEKLVRLRLFADDAAVADTPDADPDAGPGSGTAAGTQLSVLDLDAGVLVVSQFTLYGDVRKGRRPSWTNAARPEHAAPLIEVLIARLRALGVTTATGVFGADMQVSLVNDGPVTLILER